MDGSESANGPRLILQPQGGSLAAIGRIMKNPREGLGNTLKSTKNSWGHQFEMGHGARYVYIYIVNILIIYVHLK